jgi:hypothetical protein
MKTNVIISNLRNFMPNLFPKHQKVLLGRWNVDYSNPRSAEIINKKVDLSNEDHCGVCNNTINYKTIDITRLIFFEVI